MKPADLSTGFFIFSAAGQPAPVAEATLLHRERTRRNTVRTTRKCVKKVLKGVKKELKFTKRNPKSVRAVFFAVNKQVKAAGAEFFCEEIKSESRLTGNLIAI
ncbi:MAG: hypothetical protein IKN51_01535 [Bacteroidaceae bacterium]|nr:hypothetical protein [Bacteroidaceae bacterium]